MSNTEIENELKNNKIFRGVFMRDTLPSDPWKQELGIINLDESEGKGTHWCLWYTTRNKSYYFDSFGHHPPKELIQYLRNDVWYSTFQMQEIGTNYCGHLCVILAKLISKNKDFATSVYLLKNSLQ